MNNYLFIYLFSYASFQSALQAEKQKIYMLKMLLAPLVLSHIRIILNLINMP